MPNAPTVSSLVDKPLTANLPGDLRIEFGRITAAKVVDGKLFIAAEITDPEVKANLLGGKADVEVPS